MILHGDNINEKLANLMNSRNQHVNKKTNKTAILKMAQGNMPKHQIPGSLTKVTDKSELLMSSSSSISSNNNSSSTKVDPVVENTMKSNSTVQYYIATQPVFTLNNNNQSEQMAMIVHRNEIPSPNIKPITSFNQLHVFCFAYNPVRNILYMGTQSGVMFMDLSMKKPYSQKLGTLNATINCLAFDTRDYSRLYCGHNDAASNFVSWYDGNDWQTLDQGLNAPCLTMIFDSTGKTLFMGGKFTEINGFRLKSRYVCGYHVESKRWVQIGNCGLDNTCKTLAFDSACRRLYIGGDFTSFVDRMGISQPCDYILVYDMNNSNWIPYGTEALFTGVNGPVNCMAFDTVRGRLYVGGAFFESASSTTAVVTSPSIAYYQFTPNRDGKLVRGTFTCLASGAHLSNECCGMFLDNQTGRVFCTGFFTAYSNERNDMMNARGVNFAIWDPVGESWINYGPAPIHVQNADRQISMSDSLMCSICIPSSDMEDGLGIGRVFLGGKMGTKTNGVDKKTAIEISGLNSFEITSQVIVKMAGDNKSIAVLPHYNTASTFLYSGGKWSQIRTGVY